jgi:hypothetical protein
MHAARNRLPLSCRPNAARSDDEATDQPRPGTGSVRHATFRPSRPTPTGGSFQRSALHRRAHETAASLPRGTPALPRRKNQN